MRFRISEVPLKGLLDDLQHFGVELRALAPHVEECQRPDFQRFKASCFRGLGFMVDGLGLQRVGFLRFSRSLRLGGFLEDLQDFGVEFWALAPHVEEHAQPEVLHLRPPDNSFTRMTP